MRVEIVINHEDGEQSYLTADIALDVDTNEIRIIQVVSGQVPTVGGWRGATQAELDSLTALCMSQSQRMELSESGNAVFIDLAGVGSK